MGFGGFLKKVINPLTPIKGAFNGTKSLLKGDVKGAARGFMDATGDPFMAGASMAMKRRKAAGPAPLKPGVQDYFNKQSPEDQANIKASLAGNPNGMNEWFANAAKAGAVAAPPPAAMAPPPGLTPPQTARGPQPEDENPLMAMTGFRPNFLGR